MLYKILGLSLQDVVSITEGWRPGRTYPNSPADTLNSLHLRGEAVLLLVTIDIGSYGRGVMLLTIRAAGDERTHLSRPHQWRMVVLHASERLHRKRWCRVSAISRCAISRQEAIATVAMGCR